MTSDPSRSCEAEPEIVATGLLVQFLMPAPRYTRLDDE